jgi:hypothetical protein
MKRAKLQYAIKSSTRLNEGEECLSGAFNHRCKTSPPSATRTNDAPQCCAQPAAITLGKLKQLSSISTNLSSSPCQKNCREELKNETRYCLAAQLQPISDGLVVNMGFHTTLAGQRKAPYHEQEPAYMLRNTLLDLLVPLATEPLFVTTSLHGNEPRRRLAV